MKKFVVVIDADFHLTCPVACEKEEDSIALFNKLNEQGVLKVRASNVSDRSLEAKNLGTLDSFEFEYEEEFLYFEEDLKRVYTEKDIPEKSSYRSMPYSKALPIHVPVSEDIVWEIGCLGRSYKYVVVEAIDKLSARILAIKLAYEGVVDIPLPEDFILDEEDTPAQLLTTRFVEGEGDDEWYIYSEKDLEEKE